MEFNEEEKLEALRIVLKTNYKKIDNLERALRYAKRIIEAYQFEIKTSVSREGIDVGVDLKAKGFCQGTIFLNAIDDIERLEKGLTHG